MSMVKEFCKNKTIKMRICKTVLVFILFALTCCGSVSGVNVTKKFHLVTTYKANWFRALHHCLANGMLLASIQSKEENDEVVKLIKNSGYKESFWLGGTRQGNGPNYYWMGQSNAVSYTDWMTGQPDNHAGIQDCIRMWDEVDYKWDDGSSLVDVLYFVCEEEIEQ